MRAFPTDVMDSLGPALAGAVFVLVMSRVREPTRLTLNALLVSGASATYLSGGFGLFEVVYPFAVLPLMWRARTDWRFVAVGWWSHACWDLAHHAWGNPLWPFMSTSSWGCVVFDSVIAVYFFLLGQRVRRGLA